MLAHCLALAAFLSLVASAADAPPRKGSKNAHELEERSMRAKQREGPFESSGTCDGACTGKSTDCWCDDICVMYGDCCEDAKTFCCFDSKGELVDCAAPATDAPAAQANSKSKALSADGQVSSSASCRGQCGGEADGCSCGPSCTTDGTCCDDAADECCAVDTTIMGRDVSGFLACGVDCHSSCKSTTTTNKDQSTQCDAVPVQSFTEGCAISSAGRELVGVGGALRVGEYEFSAQTMFIAGALCGALLSLGLVSLCGLSLRRGDPSSSSPAARGPGGKLLAQYTPLYESL